MRKLGWCASAALLLGAAAALIAGPQARSAGATHDCGLPHTTPLWIEYGAGSVPPEVRAVFGRPGVVVSATGTAIPATYRSRGAATTYFVIDLPDWVGEPAKPAAASSMERSAETLYAQAVASTGCATPWIALNELLAPQAATPWTPTNAQYRDNIAVLVERLAARGARPALLIHGNPSTAGDAAVWWRRVSAAAHLVYEAYYNAGNISRLGPLMGNRRMRKGMRAVLFQFGQIGIPQERMGFMLGFQVAIGAAGREGLQPREEWFRVVKWHALAAKQLAADEGVKTIWSWGWGTFGPASTDPDKPAAACVYLWTRDPALCDGPGVAGPAFNTSLEEGQIRLPHGFECVFPGGGITVRAVDALVRFTRDRAVARSALFWREALESRVRVTASEIVAAERELVARRFGGSRNAYLAALARHDLDIDVARGMIGDRLRRARLAAAPEGSLLASANVTSPAVDAATCVRDDLPGYGDFPRSDLREVGPQPLPARARWLFGDRTQPTAPGWLSATPAGGLVTLDWADGRDEDLIGYYVFRATTPGGPYVRLTPVSIVRSTHVDRGATAGAPSYYVVRAVDSSLRGSRFSIEVSATP